MGWKTKSETKHSVDAPAGGDQFVERVKHFSRLREERVELGWQHKEVAKKNRSAESSFIAGGQSVEQYAVIRAAIRLSAHQRQKWPLFPESGLRMKCRSRSGDRKGVMATIMLVLLSVGKRNSPADSTREPTELLMGLCNSAATTQEALQTGALLSPSVATLLRNCRAASLNWSSRRSFSSARYTA